MHKFSPTSLKGFSEVMCQLYTRLPFFAIIFYDATIKRFWHTQTHTTLIAPLI